MLPARFVAPDIGVKHPAEGVRWKPERRNPVWDSAFYLCATIGCGGSICRLAQAAHSLLQGSYLAFGIGQLLALQLHHLCGGVLYKALVLQLLLYAGHEALQSLDFCFGLLHLGFCVNQVAQRHCILVGTDEEGL